MPELKREIYIGKSTSSMPDDMPLHAHQRHELYFLISGQRRYFIGHTIYDVFPGNLVIIPKTELHRTTSPGRIGYERYVVYFTNKDVQPLIDSVGRDTFDALMQGCCLQLPADIARQIQTDLERMKVERTAQVPYAAAFITHLLQDILLAALRYGKRRNPCTGESADKIQEVARYISENYHLPLTLHEAAQMAYMEDTYFSKRFKMLTGFGFQEYLTQTRIRAAQQLLSDTQLSVGEISERCGFSSSNYFGDAFRRWTGTSPSAYRQKTQPLSP